MCEASEACPALEAERDGVYRDGAEPAGPGVTLGLTNDVCSATPRAATAYAVSCCLKR